MSRSIVLLGLIVSLGLVGCASPPYVPPELPQVLGYQGPSPVEDASERAAQRQILLQQPLSLASARVLLLSHSPQVRAELEAVGIAEAQRIQSGLIRNPSFAVGGLRPEGGGRWQLDVGISQSLLDVFTRPLRTRLAEAELHEAQLKLLDRLNHLLSDMQSHYFMALAAQQRQQQSAQQLQAADASLSLAESLASAGNIPEREWLEHQLNRNHWQRELNRARSEASNQLLTLAQRLGVGSTETLTLPAQLPALPDDDNLNHAELLQTAFNHRSDLQLANAQWERAEQQLGLYRRTRGLDEFSAGINAERETDGSHLFGPEFEISLPLFDRGHARLAAAQAARRQAAALIEARQYQADLELARHLNSLALAREQARTLAEDALPLQRQIQSLRLREYNFMLLSAFDLLRLKQQEFDLQSQHTQALLDYWLARSELALASGTPLALDIVEQSPAAIQESSDTHQDHGAHHHD